MKTRLLMTVILLSTIVSFAQSQTSKHLLFKKIPINGTLKEFVSEMKQSGFEELESENRDALLKGDFASYKSCIVSVTTLQGKDLVGEVKVNFPLQTVWTSLASNYFNLKELLTEKYGQPSECIEKFMTINANNSGLEMMLLRQDQCKYITTYTTDRGTIKLSIKGNNSVTFVSLTYSDKINNGIVRAQAKDDL